MGTCCQLGLCWLLSILLLSFPTQSHLTFSFLDMGHQNFFIYRQLWNSGTIPGAETSATLGWGGWDHPWKCLAYYEALHSILAVLPDRGAYGTRPQPPAHIGVNSRRCGHPWFRAFFIACFFHPIGTSQFGASNVKYDKMPNKISELLLAQGGKKYIFSAHWVFGDLKHFLQL